MPPRICTIDAVTASRLLPDDFRQTVHLRKERQRIGAGIGNAAGQDVEIVLPAKSIFRIELPVQICIHMVPFRAVVLVQGVEIGKIHFPVRSQETKNSRQSADIASPIIGQVDDNFFDLRIVLYLVKGIIKERQVLLHGNIGDLFFPFYMVYPHGLILIQPARIHAGIKGVGDCCGLHRK